jgi:hypothetical protein
MQCNVKALNPACDVQAQPTGVYLMAIVQTLDKYSFIEAFKQSSRKDQFSYEALGAIFEYLEDYSDSTGSPVEFDIVGICCDWAEAHWEDIAREYSIDLNDFADDTDDYNRIEAVMQYLWDNTQAIQLGDNVIVYQQF